MKKNTKFLSFLLFAPLLTGCGNGVKAPKFAKFGDEVKFDEFYKNINAAFDKSVMFNEKKAIGSLEMQSEYDELTETATKRDKKTIDSYSDLSQEKVERQYDAENNLMKNKKEEFHSEGGENPEGSTLEEDTEIQTVTYQVGKYEKKDYILAVQHEIKQYAPAALVAGKASSMFDSIVKESVIAGLQKCISEIEMQYSGEDEKGKKDYKFYQNGNIYTIDMTWEEESESKDSEVYAKNKDTLKWTVQIDMTEGKWSGSEYLVGNTEKEFVLNKGQFAKGDVYYETYTRKNVFSAKSKKVSLKAEDLSKYTLRTH